MYELKVGQKRNFSFHPNKHFRIEEILINPPVTMKWTWRRENCPHCGGLIEEIKDHSFEKIEILIEDSLELDKLEQKDLDSIMCLGFSKDKKIMTFDDKTTLEIYKLSEHFKHLVEVNK